MYQFVTTCSACHKKVQLISFNDHFNKQFVWLALQPENVNKYYLFLVQMVFAQFSFAL
jgi:hypothetical protein